MIELGRHLRGTSGGNYPAWALAMLGCLVLSYSVFLFDGDTIYRLTEEDGIVEMLRALLFFFAAWSQLKLIKSERLNCGKVTDSDAIDSMVHPTHAGDVAG